MFLVANWSISRPYIDRLFAVSTDLMMDIDVEDGLQTELQFISS